MSTLTSTLTTSNCLTDTDTDVDNQSRASETSGSIISKSAPSALRVGKYSTFPYASSANGKIDGSSMICKKEHHKINKCPSTASSRRSCHSSSTNDSNTRTNHKKSSRRNENQAMNKFSRGQSQRSYSKQASEYSLESDLSSHTSRSGKNLRRSKRKGKKVSHPGTKRRAGGRGRKSSADIKRRGQFSTGTMSTMSTSSQSPGANQNVTCNQRVLNSLDAEEGIEVEEWKDLDKSSPVNLVSTPNNTMLKSNHRSFGIGVSLNNGSPEMIVGSEGGSILCRFTTLSLVFKSWRSMYWIRNSPTSILVFNKEAEFVEWYKYNALGVVDMASKRYSNMVKFSLAFRSCKLHSKSSKISMNYDIGSVNSRSYKRNGPIL